MPPRSALLSADFVTLAALEEAIGLAKLQIIKFGVLADGFDASGKAGQAGSTRSLLAASRDHLATLEIRRSRRLGPSI